MDKTTTASILLCLLSVASSERILGVFPIPSRSHRNLYHPLMLELVQKGHDVTVISPFKENKVSENGTYREILLTGFTEWMQAGATGLISFDRVDESVFSKLKFAFYFLNQITEMTLAHDNVQKLINSNEKFDVLIITEVMNRAHRALATHFGSSLILLSTVGANSMINPSVGNPAPPSYVPNMFLSVHDQMTFGERLSNSFIYVYFEIYSHLYVFPKQNAMIKKYIPNGPEIEQVLYNVSLVLLNSHPSVSQSVPHVPNMVEIGGFHIKPPKKLPTDLQEFLDDAPDGAIYFSMGSNLKSSNFPPEKRDIFLKTFAKLKQKILWKWENDVMPGQPKNVKLAKWLPQQDILAHPNIKLFITHGGLLSTTETIYHGVPVLAIPIFGDQKLNAEIAVSNGFAISLSFNDLTEKKLTQSIEQLLNNPKFYNTAKSRSRIFHDRLVTPMETAVYWIEYVIRHRGAPHLRVTALDLPWYQYLLLDVVAFITVLISLFCAVFYKICKVLLRLLSRKDKTKFKNN